MMASRNGHHRITELLLVAEANVGIRTVVNPVWGGLFTARTSLILSLSRQDGDCALTLASKGGHTDIIKQLVQSGAIVNTRDKVSSAL